MATLQHDLVRAPQRVQAAPWIRPTAEARARAASISQVSCAAAPVGTKEARPQAAADPRHYAKCVSATLDGSAEQRETRRHVRYAQRAVLWNVSRLERVRKCGRVRHGRDGTGDVVTRVRGGVAHFTGLTTCGSIHACPCCGSKIRYARSLEISAACARWDMDGNAVLMGTFTAPHDYGMRLSKLLPLIADGFRACISGRPWRRLRDELGIVGTIRAFECTCGEHGWHPHLHVLFFVEGGDTARAVAALALYLRAKWETWITGQGYRVPHKTHGVDVGVCHSAAQAGEYIAKTQDGRSVGNEIARGDMKQGRNGGRTPFEILDDFRWTGDVEDLALWNEWETATKGHKCITWSKGLRKILGCEPEMTDEELAEAEVGGENVAVIPAELWTEVVKIPAFDAALLHAAERGGLAGMNELLALHGLGNAESPGGVDLHEQSQQSQGQGSPAGRAGEDPRPGCRRRGHGPPGR